MNFIFHAMLDATGVVEEFKFTTPSLLLLPLVRVIDVVSKSAFLVLGHFEISSKSNSGRTRGPRSTKLLHDMTRGHPAPHTRHGPPSPFGFAARGRQRFFFKRVFLRNGCAYRDRSFGAMCPIGVPI